jgi:hypothetical protein
MSSATSFLRKKLVDHLFSIASYTPPTPLYLSLHTADPGIAGSHANEISTGGTGYARFSLAGVMSAADSITGITVNLTTITMGPALVQWDVKFLGIEDASSAGNMLLPGVPATPRLVGVGQPFHIPAGQLVIQLV